MRRSAAAAVMLLVFLLPLSARGLAVDVAAEEGSGVSDLPLASSGLETLEVAGSEQKDQLFQSLADLLTRRGEPLQDGETQQSDVEDSEAQQSEQPSEVEEAEQSSGQSSEAADAGSGNSIVVPVRLVGVNVVEPEDADDGDAVAATEAPEEEMALVTPLVEEDDEELALLNTIVEEDDENRLVSAGEAENEVPLPERQPVVEPIIVAESAPCLGCVTPIVQDSADLRRIANMAAKLLEEKLEARFAFRVTEVYRASKQVVNGIKYFLTLELAETSCERPVPAFTLCYLAEDAPHSIYAVELLHQPHRANTELLHYRQMMPAQVAPHMGLFASATAEPPTTPPSPASPSIAPGDSLLDILMGLDSVKSHQTPGGNGLMEGLPLSEGPQMRHSTDPAALHVQSILQDIGWSPKLSAARPAAGGSLHMVANGHGDDWLEASPQDVSEEPLTSGCRSGRQYDAQEVPLNVAHPRVQKILHGFLEGQERSRNTRLVITDVKSATRQTIAETNYKFDFTLGESRCAKNSSALRYSCSAVADKPFSHCKVKARERPGRPLQFNSVSCNTQWQPRCPNGNCPEDTEPVHPYGPAYLVYPDSPIQVDTRDTAFLQLLQHVQQEVNRRSRRPVLKKFVETLNATKTTYNLQETTDIVEQELYWLTLRFADTTCSHTDPPSCLEEAAPADGAATCVCDVRVSSLSWADRMRVLDMFCESELSDQLQT